MAQLSVNGVYAGPIIGVGAQSRQPLQKVIAHANCIRNRGQRRIHCANADEETRVDDIEIVELVRFAV
jgi:hypothetical protein